MQGFVKFIVSRSLLPPATVVVGVNVLPVVGIVRMVVVAKC